MMRDGTVPKELRQHSECARRERLIDEWLLPVQCFGGRAAGQRIFTNLCVGDLWVELADRSQAIGFPAVSPV